MKAIWKDQIIADSDSTIEIEGNQYFPKESVSQEYLANSSEQYTCPWKGKASYFDIKIGDEVNVAAAWSYPEPKPGAIEVVGKDFSGYIAFWKGVEVTE